MDGKVQKNGVKKKQKPLGRPPYQPTDEDHQKVSMMAAFGLTRKDIYGILKMSAATFREHHEEDYTLGLAKAVMTVASRVYKTAISEKPTAFAAQQFFLKARGGWKENQNIQLTGKNGGPLEIEHKNIIDTRNMDPEARDMLIAALEQIIESEQDHDAIDDIGSTQH